MLQHVIPERVFSIDNQLVQIHLIIKVISVDRPYAMGVSIPSFR